MTIIELIQLASNSQLVHKNSNSYAIYVNAKKTYYLGGVQARAIVQKFLKQKLPKAKKILGISASPSKEIIRGRARIIKIDYTNFFSTTKSIAQMRKGDILVTEYTAPDIILACEKASAIVTDLGGMMSHAAIISRELGIPCIVGTKIATKVFRDGDLVEVDADKGIVRRIGF